MAKWEYLCVDAPHDRVNGSKIGGETAGNAPQIESILNALGGDGWELVSVRPGAISARERLFGVTLFLKRQRS